MDLYQLHSNPEKLIWYNELIEVADLPPKGSAALLRYGDNPAEVYEIGNWWHSLFGSDEDGIEFFDALCIIAKQFPRYTESFKEYLLDDSFDYYPYSELLYFALDVTESRWPELEQHIIDEYKSIPTHEFNTPEWERYQRIFNVDFAEEFLASQ